MNQHTISCIECLRVRGQCHLCFLGPLVDGLVREAREMHGWCLEGEWMPLKKPESNGHQSGPIRFKRGSEGCLAVFTNLVEFLSSSSWQDGSPRELGTLLIALGGNGWRLKVRDPNGQRYAFYAAASFEEALTGLDVGLAGDDLDWRPEKPFQKGR